MLIACRECAENISSKAATCPKCGASTAPGWYRVVHFLSRLFFAVLAAGVIFWLMAAFGR